MLDYLFGLILFGLGLGSHPSVLGEQTDRKEASSSKQLAQLKLMRPKFTPEEQEAFQKERTKREENLKRVADVKIQELEKTFEQKQTARQKNDLTAKNVLEAKLDKFEDKEKKVKIVQIAKKYETTVTQSLMSMQKKLTSMVTLLDKITAASGALKTQGTDVSQVDSDVSYAQAKISSALFQVSALAETLPTVFSISGEDEAKADIQNAIAETKTQIETVRASFQEAHTAVGVAITSIESLTNAVEIGIWPEKK